MLPKEQRLADLDNWPLLASFLPTGWQEQAKTSGALTRSRGVSGPEPLLRILLIHLANGYSLAETTVRARQTGLADMTAVALFKRLRASEHWLQWLAKELGVARGWELPAGNLRYRAIDATVVSEPGSTGTDWRLHYSLCLNDLRCDFFEITDVKGGETWRRIPVSEGDVLLGDRIYGTPTGVAHVLAAKGEVIVRINHRALPLFESDERSFPMAQRFRKLRVGQPQQWNTFAIHEGRRLQGRLIAVKRSAEATRRARKRMSQKASRKQEKISQESWRLAPYFFVWTSLPDRFDPDQILEAYRLRWQIELSFKRMKSILGFGHLPKKDPASARAWLHGKLFVSLLAEHLIAAADAFSPWGYAVERKTKPLA
jgi:DDE family transposase